MFRVACSSCVDHSYQSNRGPFIRASRSNATGGGRPAAPCTRRQLDATVCARFARREAHERHSTTLGTGLRGSRSGYRRLNCLFEDVSDDAEDEEGSPPCPCGQTEGGNVLAYPDCCGKYHSGAEVPQTPETLMRSRYSAYALNKLEYVEKTMVGPPLEQWNRAESEKMSQVITWTRLEVMAVPEQEEEDEGVVEFRAYYQEAGGGQEGAMSEISDFRRVDGRWYYTGTRGGTVIGKEQRVPEGAEMKVEVKDEAK